MNQNAMNLIILGIVSILCFWKALLQGWSAGVISGIVILFLLGFFAMKFFIRRKKTGGASVLAAVIFMISIAPQTNLPKMYFGIIPLLFFILGARRKPFILFLFIGLHIAKYIIPIPLFSYILPGIANFAFCFFAVNGADIILSPSENLIRKILRSIKILALSLLPLFYFLLLYSYVENKQLFFFISKFFNIASLALLFMFYLAYLLNRSIQDAESIYLRLFIATVLESLTVLYLF